MPITFVTQSTRPLDNAALDSTLVGINQPTNMQEGDLIVWIAWSRVAGNTYTINNDGGQAWNILTSGSTTSMSHRVQWARFNGTWTSPPSMSFGTNTNSSLQMLIFRPSTGSNYWQVSGSISGSNFTAVTTGIGVTGFTSSFSSSVTIAAWNSVDDNSWLITGSGTWTTGGLAAQYRNNSTADSSIAYAYAIISQSTQTAIPLVQNRQVALGGDAGRTFRVTFYEFAPTNSTTIVQWTGDEDYF